MEWIVFALLAPFSWAISNHLDKFALDKIVRGAADFIFFGSFPSALFFLSIVAVRGFEYTSSSLVLYGIFGGMLVNYAYILYATALKRSDASLVAPLFQTIPIFVLVIGYIFLGDMLSLGQFAGFSLVFLGGFILSFRRRASSTIFGLRLRGGFWYMLAASALIGVSTVITAYVLRQSSFWTAATYDSLGFSLAALTLAIYPPWRKEIAEGVRRASIKKYIFFLVNDATDLLGHVFYKLALLSAPTAALVSVMFGTSPFFVLVLGLAATVVAPRFVEEDISFRVLLHKSGSILIIFAGIALIFLL